VDSGASEGGGGLSLPPLGAEEEEGFFSASDGEEERQTAADEEAQGPRRAQNISDRHAFAEACGFEVRSSSYLSDRKKYFTDSNMFALECVDVVLLVSADGAGGEATGVGCASEHPQFQACRLRREKPGKFFFSINWRCGNLQVVCSWAVDKRTASWLQEASPERTLLEKFIEGSEAWKNGRLKIIPRVVEGPWLARKAAGQTPAIIGKKLSTRYHGKWGGEGGEDTGADFVEAEIDVFSSAAARGMLGVLVGAAKSLVIDIGVVIEAQEDAELPEKVLAGFRVQYVDLGKCRKILV
jgi:hypothetical protein